LLATYRLLVKLGKGTDVVNLARNRYVLNCLESDIDPSDNLFFWSTVKERNTWQVRSHRNGSIDSIQDANSIVGDLSFFKLDTKRKVIVAFSTYSASGYLSRMCTLVLNRLIPKSLEFSLDYLSDNKIVQQIRSWDYYSRISLKINSSLISNEDDVPDLIKAMSLEENDPLGGITGVFEIITGERILNPDAKILDSNFDTIRFIMDLLSNPEKGDNHLGIKLRRELATSILGLMNETAHPYPNLNPEERKDVDETLIEIFKKYPKEILEEVIKREDLKQRYQEYLKGDKE